MTKYSLIFTKRYWYSLIIKSMNNAICQILANNVIMNKHHKTS